MTRRDLLVARIVDDELPSCEIDRGLLEEQVVRVAAQLVMEPGAAWPIFEREGRRRAALMRFAVFT